MLENITPSLPHWVDAIFNTLAAFPMLASTYVQGFRAVHWELSEQEANYTSQMRGKTPNSANKIVEISKTYQKHFIAHSAVGL